MPGSRTVNCTSAAWRSPDWRPQAPRPASRPLAHHVNSPPNSLHHPHLFLFLFLPITHPPLAPQPSTSLLRFERRTRLLRLIISRPFDPKNHYLFLWFLTTISISSFLFRTALIPILPLPFLDRSPGRLPHSSLPTHRRILFRPSLPVSPRVNGWRAERCRLMSEPSPFGSC